MKRLFILLLVVVFMGAACQNEEPQEPEPTAVESSEENSVAPETEAESEEMMEISFNGTGQWGQYSTIAEYESATGETIAGFHQSPSLDGMDLPAVEERLPKDAMVVLPANQIGTYGGTLQGAGGGLTGELWEFPFSYVADLGQTVPNIIKGFEVNDDATEYTFFLREGLKWSDGEPMTADDWVWYYDNILLNEEIWPDGRDEYKTDSGMGTLTKVNEYTIQYTFQEPNGLFPLTMSRVNPPFTPVHYMSQFHPDFADAAQLEQMINDSGLPDWAALWEVKDNYTANPEMPTIFKWVLASDPTDSVQILERNPYYWKIDPAGNQLPYIDAMQQERGLEAEVMLVKGIAGELDYLKGEDIDAQSNYALLKESEDSGNYQIVPAIRSAVGLGNILFNYAIEDEVLGELFHSFEFREALSIGTDRDAINNILYNGLMIPSQWAPADGPPYNGERDIFTQYAGYDPDQANTLLDGLGLAWDGDARVRSDGDPLEIVMFMNQGEECQDSVAIAELLKAQWEETLGIQVVIRPIDGDFWVFAEEGELQGIFLTCYGMGEEYPASLGGGMATEGSGGGWVGWSEEAMTQLSELNSQFQAATDPASAVAIEREIAELHADNLWVVGLLKRPSTYVQSNLHLFSSRMDNLSTPMPNEWQYVAMESWFIKE